MKVATTRDRLKQIMSERNLRPIDILRQSEYYQKEMNIKLNKVNLSHYISGRNEPNKEKVRLLAKTLKVSEQWLNGFDAPKDAVLTKSELYKHFDMVNQSDKIALDVKYLEKNTQMIRLLVISFQTTINSKINNVNHYCSTLIYC